MLVAGGTKLFLTGSATRSSCNAGWPIVAGRTVNEMAHDLGIARSLLQRPGPEGEALYHMPLGIVRLFDEYSIGEGDVQPARCETDTRGRVARRLWISGVCQREMRRVGPHSLLSERDSSQ